MITSTDTISCQNFQKLWYLKLRLDSIDILGITFYVVYKERHTRIELSTLRGYKQNESESFAQSLIYKEVY